MKSGLMVSWAERRFSSAAARLLVLLLILGAAGSAQAVTYPLLIQNAGTGAGIVSSTPSGISCGSSCSQTFVYDANNPTVVILSASPAVGSTFTGWSVLVGGSVDKSDGCDTATTSSTRFCAVVMDKAKTVVATFAYSAAALGLTVTKDPAGTGSGTISSDPGPMYCGPSCYGSFAPTTVVTLTATPAAGSKFVGWNGGGAANVVTAVAVNASAKTVTLTLTSAATAGQSIALAYTKPSSGYAIQDVDGNGAASFLSTSVSNLTPDPSDGTAPVFSQATVNGYTLVMSYTDANNLDDAHIPAPGAFAVTVAGAARTVKSVAVNSSAKTVTLTLASAVISAQAVTVAYTDPTAGNDANAIQDVGGNDAATLGAAAVTNLTATAIADSTAPVFASATVDGNKLVMRYTDAENPLDDTNIPVSGDFAVLVGGSTRAVSTVAVNGPNKTVTLTLAAAVTAGQAVTVAYTDPTAGNDVNAIQDGAGNDAATLAATAVTNLTGVDTVAPVFTGATVNGNTLVMSYSDAANDLDASSIPVVGAFSVQVGGCSTSTPTCVVTMPAASAVSVSAKFDTDANAPKNLYVVKSGSGSGIVRSAPAGIYCGAFCNETFSLNSLVTLTAAPDSGSTFTGWTGDCSGSALSCVVTMSAARAVTATFALTSTVTNYTLTVLRVGSGTGTVKSVPAGINDCAASVCTADYANGTLVVLTATPASGSSFAGWGGGVCSGVGTCIVTMSAAKSVTMTFDSSSSTTNFTLTVLGAGSGAGRIKSTPIGIDCNVLAATPTACSNSYPTGTLVALTAAAAANNTFVGWLGDCTGTGTCIVPMDKARNVTATFDSLATSAKKTLFLYKLGTGSGAVTSDPSGIDCPASGCSSTSASFDQNTLVTLTATRAQGSSFTGWSGSGSAVAVNTVEINGAAKTVTLTLASAVTAGQSVTLAYTDPTSGNDGNAIQDIFGNDAVSLPTGSVTNLTGVTADITPPHFSLATVNGNTLVMSYIDAAHNLDASNKPAVGAFSVKVGDGNTASVVTISSIAINSLAKTITLTLASAVSAGQSVTVSYTDPTTANDINATQDTSGNDAATLLETSVTNLTGTSGDSIPPKFALATVKGNQLVMSYTGPADLNEANIPAVGAFAVQVGGVNGCIGSATTCQVTMDAAKTVTATFDGVSPTFFTVHVSKMGEGRGTIKSAVASSQDPIDCDLTDKDCDGSFSLGTPVVLKAVAESGSKFASWTGCTNKPSSTEDCYVLKTLKDVETDGTSYGVTGTFTKAASAVRTLWVTKQGAGTGTITSSSSPNQPNIDCGGICTLNYNPGTTVTLTASPGAPAFTGWKGACTGTLATCTFTMESGKSVIATFIPSVTASLAGTGSGVVTSQPAGINCGGSCTAIFASGSSAILTATPKSGSLFAGWAGPCSGSATACTVGTSVTQNVTAMFSLANAAPAKPGAPLISTAKPGPGSAAIYFAAPTSLGSSPLIRYDARCQATGLSSATASGTESPIVVSKLTPRTAYACSVTAVNSVGVSPASAALSVTPGSNSINSIFQLLLD